MDERRGRESELLMGNNARKVLRSLGSLSLCRSFVPRISRTKYKSKILLPLATCLSLSSSPSRVVHA